ncbi:MAG: UDP-2,3-diacylglucosamine diphosphatase [Myxococcota bacterium]
MSVAILADSHIGGPGGPVEPLVAQMRALPEQGATRLVLLGDLFQVWVGYEQYETPEVAAFLAVVDELRGRGVRVDYIEGNRDFFLAEGPYRKRFDSVGFEVALRQGALRYLFVHGDGLNDRDRQYLAWRWLSKSAPVRAVIRHLPAAVVARFVHSAERKLTGTNFKHKVRVPEAAIRAFGERRLAEGHDVLFLGHFHEAQTFRVRGGEIRLLDAWFRSRRVEWLR